MENCIKKFNSQIPLLMMLFLCLPIFGEVSRLQEQLGSKNLEIIKNAKFVTILSMVPERARAQYGTIKELHLSNDEMAKLKRNILEDHNYDFDRKKSCKFLPEISFKFEDDQEEVLHLFVSPSCNQMLFGTDSYSLLLNYDPAHERLEHYFKQLVEESRGQNKETLTWH
jgi:hypothetical protein